MNYTEHARESAANFLETMVKEVSKLLTEDPTYGHYFAKVISRTNPKVRSIEGFLSILAPNQVRDRGEEVYAINFPHMVFKPAQIGVPISNRVWTALTVYWTQETIGEPPLPRQATFEQVSALWMRVAERYRHGQLDSELLDEDEMDIIINHV